MRITIIGKDKKYTSAIIIDNVLIDDAKELSYKEMKNVIYQFIET